MDPAIESRDDDGVSDDGLGDRSQHTRRPKVVSVIISTGLSFSEGGTAPRELRRHLPETTKAMTMASATVHSIRGGEAVNV